MCNKFWKIYFLNFFFPIFTLKKKQQQVLILESNSQSQANKEMALPCTTWLKRSNSKSHRNQGQLFLALLRSSSLHCLKTLNMCCLCTEENYKKNWDGVERSIQEMKEERILQCIKCSLDNRNMTKEYPICHCLQGCMVEEEEHRPVLFPVSDYFPLLFQNHTQRNLKARQYKTKDHIQWGPSDWITKWQRASLTKELAHSRNN